MAWIALVLFLGGMLAGLPLRADDPPVAEKNTCRFLKGIDVDGRLHHFAATPDCKAVVVVFLATSCPISNGSLPTLQKLAARYKTRGIEFYGVVSAPNLSREKAAKHRDEYRISFPVLFDASANLRSRLKPTHTPQAMVLSPVGQVLYSGRIDDLYPSIGRKRDVPSEHELEDALADIVAGRTVAVPVTTPVGCVLENPPTAKVGDVTFNRDVAPILFTSCVECHRPGEAGHFSLMTYVDACEHANQIAFVTDQRTMPPWHPTEGFGHFRNDRRLKDDEIALLQKWVADGLPEGEAGDRPTPPKFIDGWQLGKPDLILKMSEPFAISADGPDIHQHFVLPTGLKRNRLISAIEFRAGNPRVAHHASFYVDTSGVARMLDQRDPQPGYGSFAGPGFDNYGAFRSWLPGQTPQRLPLGTGSALPSHSDIVLEIHYQRTGKSETDQSSIGIFYAEASAKQQVLELQVMNKALDIPAGDSRHHHRATFTLPAAATLLDAAPHMHLLGREMKATATLPGGEVKPLVWVPDWNFNWQGQYIYVDPLRLPKGTVITVDAWFDNSAGNPLNPHSPPQRITWGEQTRDEMSLCHFRYLCDSDSDMLAVHNSYRAHQAEQQRRYQQVQTGTAVVKP